MATYYIKNGGNNALDGLSVANAWETLYYASTQAVTAGDIIHVIAGTYDEAATAVISPGVSIVGEGDTSIITTTTLANILINLYSSPIANGNQSISYIKVDGNLTALRGIRIVGRNNVEVHHVTIVDTVSYGTIFGDSATRVVTTPCPTYITGCSLHDCVISNCGTDRLIGSSWDADAAVDISGQGLFLCYNNNIDNQTGGRYAYGIKSIYGGGYTHGLKIYNNVIRTNIRDAVGEYSFGFNIELWSGTGGIEIYNNDCNGAIDIGGYGWTDAAGYGFTVRMHHNTIINPVLMTNTGESGVNLESGGTGGFEVYNNFVQNFTQGLSLGTTAASLVAGWDDVKISYNIFCNIGYTAATGGDGMGGYTTFVVTGTTMNNIKVLNNIFHRNTKVSGHGFHFPYAVYNTWTNIQYRNNIMINFYSPFMLDDQVFDGFNVDNNIIFEHTNATIIDNTGGSIVNDTFDNNQVGVDPKLVGGYPYDWSLQDSSPAIDAGIDVGLTSDFIGTTVPYGSAPDIGAYEWWVITPEPPPSFTNITLVNTPACYNAVDNTIISRWVATECPINFTLLRRDWYVINSSDVGGFLAVNIYGAFTGNDNDVISVYDATTNSMYTGTITDKSGDPTLITDIPYVAGMSISYLNDHTLYAGYYFEGRLTINGVVEALTVIASPDSFGYADLDVSGILRIKTSIGKVTNYLSLIQKDTNKSGQFTLEYRGCWYGSNEAYISEGSQTSPAADVIWYYAECVRSEEQGCNLAEYVPTDLNDAPFLNQFDTPVYWYGLPFDLSFILPERAELSPTADIIVTMKVYDSANAQIGGDITQTISVDSLEGYVNSLNIDSTLISAGAAYFTVEIFAM